MRKSKKTKSSKDIQLKEKKINLKGNIKDFHGRRQHGDNILVEEETRKSTESSKTKPIKRFPKKPTSTSSTFFLAPQANPKNIFLPKHINKTKRTNWPSVLDHPKKYSFDSHMSQWAQDLRKPLARPSIDVEFDMPYCYSEGLYSKVSAESFLKQPLFRGIFDEPATELWSPPSDSCYEKAQLALQYYRHLCEQPSRIPLQTITIKRSIAQLAAEQCALFGKGVYFEIFHNSGVRIGNIVFEEENKSTLYLITDEESTIKAPGCSCMQVKSDSSIFTSSWQN